MSEAATHPDGKPILTNEAKGYRDIYWCFIINEPFIIQYEANVPCCSLCGGNPLNPDLQMHTFLGHVNCNSSRAGDLARSREGR